MRDGMLDKVRDMREADGGINQIRMSTLRERLTDTISRNRNLIKQLENEIETSNQAIGLLDKNKSLETLINLLGK